MPARKTVGRPRKKVGRPRKFAVARPKRRTTVVRRRRQQGNGFFGSIWKGLKSVAKFFKRNKIISKVGTALGDDFPIAGQIGKVARNLGYGKRRVKARKCGAGLSRAGGGLKRAGAGKTGRRKNVYP